MKPIQGKDFSDHLNEVIAIDSVTLPAEYVTSLEKLEERFHTFEDPFVGMLDDSMPKLNDNLDIHKLILKKLAQAPTA